VKKLAGAGAERGSGVTEIGVSGERKFYRFRSRSAHMAATRRLVGGGMINKIKAFIGIRLRPGIATPIATHRQPP